MVGMGAECRTGRKIAGVGEARQIGETLGVDGHAVGLVGPRAAEVGGVGQGRPCWVDLGGPGVGAAAAGRLDGVAGDREGAAGGPTDRRRLARNVHGDAGARLAAAAEVTAIQEIRAIRLELGDEGIGAPSSDVRSLEGPGRGGEH